MLISHKNLAFFFFFIKFCNFFFFYKRLLVHMNFMCNKIQKNFEILSFKIVSIFFYFYIKVKTFDKKIVKSIIFLTKLQEYILKYNLNSFILMESIFCKNTFNYNYKITREEKIFDLFNIIYEVYGEK